MDTTQNQGGLAPQGTANPGYNANASQGQAGSLDPTLATPVSQTQDASQINNQMSGTSGGVQFPQAPGAPTTGTLNDTGAVAPTAADIISQGTQQTPAEKTNQTQTGKLLDLLKNKLGLQTMTNQSESSAGIPALARAKQTISDQIQGYADQAQKLQNDAMAGGTIQNTEQQNALGRGITAGGLAPLTAADLRENQIKLASIAAASLTAKSAYYAINEQYSSAKDAADKAASAQYEAQQNQIDYQNAVIDANKAQMTKEEQAQADLVKQNLADRQTKIDQAKEDKTTIIGWAVAAMKNNPNDPKALYAAQQALTESNQQQPDIQKALGLVGKYQSDPLATQAQLADIAYKRSQTVAASASAAGVPDNQNTNIDPTTQGLLGTMGVSYQGFLALTGQASLLPRDQATRNKAFNEAAQFLKDHTDVQPGTLGAQYASVQKVIQFNNTRQSMAKVQENEIQATINNLKNVAPTGTISNLNFGNVAKIWAGQQVNDPTAQQYAFHLEQLRNEIVAYNLIAQGQINSDGSLKQADAADVTRAENVLKNGVASGSLSGLSTAVTNSTQKMTPVLQASIDAANKEVWDIFGVGDKYKSSSDASTGGTVLMTGPDGKDYNVPSDKVDAFIKAGGKKK